MSAPRNTTPTPHRGIPVTIPSVHVRDLEYQGRHRFVEGRTPGQFTVSHLRKVHRPVAR